MTKKSSSPKANPPLAEKSLSFVPATREKIEHFSRIAPKDMRLPKRFRAVAGMDREGKPAWFLFDLFAFWEFVCRIDERLFEALPDNKYESVSLGKLIDTLEERWPFSEEYKNGIKREYEKALKDIKAGRVKKYPA